MKLQYFNIISKINYIFYYKIFNNILNYIIQRFYNLFFFIAKKNLLTFINIFKNNSLFQFNTLLEGTAIDFIEKKKRFTLKYFFLSTFFNIRSTLTLKLKEFSFILSLKTFYYSSKPIEREIWDMFGIYFFGNWGLKRILTDYGFLGKPLRKDFPVIGFVELIFDDSNKTIKFESIQLIQKFRSFEFNNPWS